MPKIKTYTVKEYLKRLYIRSPKTGKFEKHNGRKNQYLYFEDYEGNKFLIYLKAGKHNKKIFKQITEQLRKKKNFAKLKEILGFKIIKKLKPKPKKPKISFPKKETFIDRYGNERITYYFEIPLPYKNIDDENEALSLTKFLDNFFKDIVKKSIEKFKKLDYSHFTIIVKLSTIEKGAFMPYYVRGDTYVVRKYLPQTLVEISKLYYLLIIKRIKEILKDYNIKLDKLLIWVSFVRETNEKDKD